MASWDFFDLMLARCFDISGWGRIERPVNCFGLGVNSQDLISRRFSAQLEMAIGFQCGPQHKLLVLLRRNVKGFFLQRFVSHAAR